MAEQMRPASPEQAPDPSHNYERSHPGRESDTGGLDKAKAVPQRTEDKSKQAVPNANDGTRQINAHDATNQRGGAVPEPPKPFIQDE